MWWLGKARAARRALTLAEVLGAMAITAAIAGLILGIFVDMRRSVAGRCARLQMRTSAETIAEQVAASLHGAARPEAFDTPIEPTPLFASNRCRVIASPAMRSAGFWVSTIEESPAQPGARGAATRVVLRRQQAIAAGADADRSGAAAPRELGSMEARFSASMRFRYATASDLEAPEPVFRDGLAAGEYPRLVELRVEIADLDGALEPFACSSVVEMLE